MRLAKHFQTKQVETHVREPPEPFGRALASKTTHSFLSATHLSQLLVESELRRHFPFAVRHDSQERRSLELCFLLATYLEMGVFPTSMTWKCFRWSGAEENRNRVKEKLLVPLLGIKWHSVGCNLTLAWAPEPGVAPKFLAMFTSISTGL